MREYKATVTYEIDDGKGVCQRDYIITAENEDNDDLLAMSRWNTEVMAESSHRTLSFECEITEI